MKSNKNKKIINNKTYKAEVYFYDYDRQIVWSAGRVFHSQESRVHIKTTIKHHKTEVLWNLSVLYLFLLIIYIH